MARQDKSIFAGIKHLEMVLDELCTMSPLRHFIGLETLTLCGCGIMSLAGLDSCVHLTKLWLNQNQIDELPGLVNCKKLEELYLCSNNLHILGSNLLGLEKLKILWVADNKITSLKGLNYVPQLIEVNAAQNQIETIGGTLENNLKLQSLTLAGNRIAKFREIEEMTALPALVDLNFADPDFGENPICSLCNYWTFILYHLPNLKTFDKFCISEEAQKQAESTYLKKHLYYSMRIKTVQRQGVDAFRWAQSLKNDFLGEVCKLFIFMIY